MFSHGRAPNCTPRRPFRSQSQADHCCIENKMKSPFTAPSLPLSTRKNVLLNNLTTPSLGYASATLPPRLTKPTQLPPSGRYAKNVNRTPAVTSPLLPAGAVVDQKVRASALTVVVVASALLRLTPPLRWWMEWQAASAPPRSSSSKLLPSSMMTNTVRT